MFSSKQIVMKVAQLYECTICYKQTVRFKRLNFVMCEICLNKGDFFKKDHEGSEISFLFARLQVSLT